MSEQNLGPVVPFPAPAVSDAVAGGVAAAGFPGEGVSMAFTFSSGSPFPGNVADAGFGDDASMPVPFSPGLPHPGNVD